MISYGMKAAVTSLALVTAMGATQATAAVPIAGLYDTGVNDAGLVNAAGTVDSHYIVTDSNKVGFITPSSAFAASHPSWSANSPVGSDGSSWISPFVSGGVAQRSGSYPTAQFFDYTLTFALGSVGQAVTAMISGAVQSDNYVRILLNGVDIGGQTPVPPPGSASYFRRFTTFGSNAGFLNGQNTLTFRVTDYGVISGLRVDGLTGSAAAVPEPATWMMMILGFGLVAATARRRRRTNVRFVMA